MDTRDKLERLQDELNYYVLERRDVIEGTMAAIVARQHVLQLGDPGTGKSMLAKAICDSIMADEGMKSAYFYWLLTKFTVPDEIFGPVSVKGLKEDCFKRITSGKLPGAHIAFLDEPFKSSSSILNTLLTVMNERFFFNNGTPEKVPLITMFSASNELPESSELNAMFDRYLVRFWVPSLKEEYNFKRMVKGEIRPPSMKITLKELEEANLKSKDVILPDAVLSKVVEIKRILEKEGVVASDRRWRESMSLVKAHSWLVGLNEVTDDELAVLQHTLWSVPEDRSKVSGTVIKVAAPSLIKATEIRDAASELVKGLPEPGTNKAVFISRVAEAQGQVSDQLDKLREIEAKAPQGKKARVNQYIGEIEEIAVDMQKKLLEATGVRTGSAGWKNLFGK